jgi:hypothetical protein
MTAMRVSLFTHDFLLLFAAPLIWGLHFVAIYGFTGVLCARPGANASWLGLSVATWVLVAAGLAAAAAIVACMAVAPRDAARENRRFVRRVGRGLGGLATVAIAWETMAVLIVPGCP